MKVSEIIKAMEAIVPPSLAASWDNVGLLIGDPAAKAGKLLLCIDLTAAVLEEARAAGAGMVMAYHPPIFKPLSRLTPEAAPAVYEATRRGVAVYSMHTALDAAVGGTHDALADAVGIGARSPLEPTIRKGQCKVVTFVPNEDLSRVAEATFSAGAGRISSYFDCAFFVHGIGAFCGGPGTHPRIGMTGRHEATEEMRLEVIAPLDKAAAVCAAIRSAHSYETPAIDVYPLEEFPDGCGMGRIGRLARPAGLATLTGRVKKAAGVQKALVAVSGGRAGKKISVAACCAGSCGELWKAAASAGAQVYVTGEMRHHDALAAAAAGMAVICLGHSHSERLALKSLAQRLRDGLPKLKVELSRQDRDPFEVV